MTASATAYRCLKKRCSSFSLVEYTYNVCRHHHQQQHYTIIYSCVCNGRRKGWKAFHNRLQDRSATERSLRDFLTSSGFTCYYCTPPVRFYPLLISILLYTISDSSWLSVCQASREMLLVEIRNWKEEEQEAIEGEIYHNNEPVSN